MAINSSNLTRLMAASVLTGGLALPIHIHAQTPEQAVDSTSGSPEESATVTYPADFFAQYNPNTVNDMLDWIPGISTILSGGGGPGGGGGNERGLGGEENILINGQRMAGKSNSPRDQLRRIPAGEVDYIDIIRGSSADMGVRSSGQIINIVLTDELSGSSVTAEINADRYHDGTIKPGGSISYSRQQGALNTLLSLSAEPRYEYRDSFENSFLGDRLPNGTISRDEISDRTDFEINSTVTYDVTPRDRVQFNVLWQHNDPADSVDREVVSLETSPPEIFFEREDIDGSRDAWEIGGDYEHVLPSASRFRILAIASRNEQSRFRERFVSESASGEETKDLVINTLSVAQERILRSSFTWVVSDTQDLQLGTEVAQNILESSLAQGSPSGSGPATPQTGGLPQVAINNANATVEEIRYEPFAVHNWQLAQNLNLESQLTAEFSEIEQRGDVDKSRSFEFLRPSLLLRYDLTPSLQLRTQIEKQVSQLRFDQFVASTDTGDEQQQTEAGNPELEQEQTWRYEANLEYRLPDDLGVINTQLFYEDIDNVIDRVDLTPNAAQPTGATGNIGEAEKYGLQINTSTRLAFVGLPDAIVTTGLELEDSSVVDPILGIERRLERHGRGSVSLGFRHDLPAQRINYGFNIRHGFNDNRKRFDVNRIESYNSDPFMFAFIQKTAFDGIVFRLESRNVLNSGRCRERRRFDGRISDPLPSLIEESCSTDGRVWALKIRTTF